MVFEIHLTRFQAFENRLSSSLPPTERWALSCYLVLYVLWLLLYCIMITFVIIMMTIVRIVINNVLYQDDYCMYLDDYCIVSWWIHSTGKCSEVKSYMQKFCSLWKNYILCDLQRNGRCFSVWWFFCAGCNCFRREIVLPDKRYWCIQHNTWVYDPHQ